MVDSIQNLGKLHQIQQEREKLKQELAEVTAPLKEAIKKLEAEEEVIRTQLEEEAKKQGNKLNYPGVGSVSVTEKEVYVITDEEEAFAVVKDNPSFSDAKTEGWDKKKFVALAAEIHERTGDLVSCVEKKTQSTVTIRLAKQED